MKETQDNSWKQLFQLILKSKLPWHLYIIGIIVAFGSTSIALGLPMVMQELYAGNIFDTALINKYIWLSIAGTFIGSLSYLFVLLTPPIATRNIQRSIWSKLIRMPMREYNKNNSLNLISRVTIDPTFIDEMIARCQSIIIGTYSLVGSLVIMYSMNVKLTLALLPIIPYTLIVSVVVGHYTQKTQYRVQDKLSGLTAFFAERLPKVRLIKTFGKEQQEMEQGSVVIKQQYTAEKRRALVDLFGGPLLDSVQAIVVGTVLIYGGILAARGEMDISEVIAFYLYVQFIHTNVLKYGIFWQYLKQTKGAAAKISSIRDLDDEVVKRQRTLESVSSESNGNLRFENVAFSYDDKKVLSNINFTIPEGKVTAIVGPSGSGKTTIFSLLERLYEPNVGRIMIGNVNANEVHLDEWRKEIAYVSQQAPLLSGTIRDNITYGIDEPITDEEVRKAAEMAAALEFIEKLPQGLDTEVGEFGSKLSGGQRQRIAIARAFITNPKYLLLDEATSNQDARNEHLIKDALKVLMEGRTTVIISHDLKEMAGVDQVIVVDDGKVTGTGNHKELVQHNELYRNLIELQNEKTMKMQLGLS